MNKKKLIILLGCLSAIGPFSIDMYLSSFPSIAAHFNTSIENVALSLSSFFIGISLGQLLYGPLMDRFGRKTPLMAGLVVYLTSSLGCIFASSIQIFICLRLIQALGGCAGVVAARATIRDLFTIKESADMFSALMLVIGISPILAPIFGSYIAITLGWKFIFITLSAVVLVLLVIVHLFLPQRHSPDKNASLAPVRIVKTYIGIFKEPAFHKNAISGSLASASFYIYLAGSPYVFLNYFKLTEQQFSWLFAVIAAGLILSSQLNRLVLTKYKTERIIRIGLSCQLIIGAFLFAGNVPHLLNLYETVILILLFFSCHGFISANCSALSLASINKNKGSASALLGFCQLGFGAVASTILNLCPVSSPAFMTAGMFLLALLSFATLSKKDFDEINKKINLNTN